MRMTRLSAALLLVACSSPPPYAVVTVKDPDRLATDAVAIAYGRDLEALTPIELNGETLPVEFVLWSEEATVVTVWVDALGSDDDTLGRGRVTINLEAGGAAAVEVQLAYVCGDTPLAGSEHCALESDTSGTAYRGVCAVAGSCQVSRCGDGVIDPDRGEDCDDGDAVDNGEGGCVADCSALQTCGNASREGTELCDGGDTDTSACDYAGGSGPNACTPAECGDGYANAEAGEDCEEGTADTATCDWADGTGAEACTFAECGDGYVNAAAGEQCDEGSADTATCDWADGTGAEACTPVACNDGYVNNAAGEDCEPGLADTVDCDFDGETGAQACTAAECGDGYLNATAGEVCDEGSADTATCDYAGGAASHGCTPATCGDGYRNLLAMELCDEGSADTATCDYDDGVSPHACTPAACGDGYANAATGEDCDTTGDTAVCDYAGGDVAHACTAAVCGDGHLNLAAGETCDDGDGDNADSCPDGLSGTCQAPICGDGHVWSSDGGSEECDNGGAFFLGSCFSTCLSAFPWTAQGVLSSAADSDAAVADHVPRVVSGGGGVWMAIWHGEQTPNPEIEYDVYVATSSDDGGTWSTQTAVNPNAGSDVAVDWYPDLATDGAGNWVAVWEYQPDVFTVNQVVASRSVDNGASWSAAVEIGDPANTGWDRRPRLATDGAGTWIVVWDRLTGDDDIRFACSTDAGASWPTLGWVNSDASTDGTDDDETKPALATDGTTWVAVWQSQVAGADSEIELARADDPCSGWSATITLNSNAALDGANDSNPTVSGDGTGNWLVVWQSPEDLGGVLGGDSDLFWSRSLNGGLSWTNLAPLNTNAAIDNLAEGDWSPVAVSPAAGEWVVIWRSTDDLGGVMDTDADIFYARSVDGGDTWSDPGWARPGAPTDTPNDIEPHFATDGAGHYVLVWVSGDDFGGTIGTDTDVFFSTATFP